MEKNYMQKTDIPSSKNFEMGGDTKECNILNQNLGQFVECQSQDFGKDIVKQDYALKNSNVCYSQFNPEFFKTSDILNPTTTTFKDLENHMRTIQDLESETIKSTMRILKKMEDACSEKRDVIKIMITGFADQKNAMASLNFGADAFLMKPISVEKVLDVIEEKLKMRLEN